MNTSRIQNPCRRRGCSYGRRWSRVHRGGVPACLHFVHDGAGYLLKMGLDLADRHVAGVEREDFVMKAGPAGLVLWYGLRLEPRPSRMIVRPVASR